MVAKGWVVGNSISIMTKKIMLFAWGNYPIRKKKMMKRLYLDLDKQEQVSLIGNSKKIGYVTDFQLVNNNREMRMVGHMDEDIKERNDETFYPIAHFSNKAFEFGWVKSLEDRIKIKMLEVAWETPEDTFHFPTWVRIEGISE